jgi:hypothetical protein
MRLSKEVAEDRKKLQELYHKINSVTNKSINTRKIVGQCHVDKLHLMKDNAEYEAKVSDEIKFKDTVQLALEEYK